MYCGHQSYVCQCVGIKCFRPEVNRTLLYGAMKKLEPREKELMEMRFGLKSGKEMTQKEVADKLGISQSYISRLEKRIISRLQKEIKKLG